MRTVDKFHNNKVELHEVEITVKAYFDNKQLNNGDFETGDLTGWTVDGGRVHTDNAVSGLSTFWGENISYNQGGNYHFDAWRAWVFSPFRAADLFRLKWAEERQCLKCTKRTEQG